MTFIVSIGVPAFSPSYSWLRVSENLSIEQRFVSGEEAALREVYDLHGSLIYSLCKRSLGESEAADATQDVFLNAWKGRHRFDPTRGNLPAWLVGIAKNRIIDIHRARGRRPQIADVEIDLGEPAEVDKLASQLMARQILDNLSDRQRQHVEMFFFKDLSHAQISEETKVPLGTVKSDIRRGLQKLKLVLENSDV